MIAPSGYVSVCLTGALKFSAWWQFQGDISGGKLKIVLSSGFISEVAYGATSWTDCHLLSSHQWVTSEWAITTKQWLNLSILISDHDWSKHSGPSLFRFSEILKWKDSKKWEGKWRRCDCASKDDQKVKIRKIIRSNMGWQSGSTSWALSWVRVSHMLLLFTQCQPDKS